MDATNQEALKRKAVFDVVNDAELVETEKRLDDLLGAISRIGEQAPDIQWAVAAGGLVIFMFTIVIAFLLYAADIMLSDTIFMALFTTIVVSLFVSVVSITLYWRRRRR